MNIHGLTSEADQEEERKKHPRMLSHRIGGDSSPGLIQKPLVFEHKVTLQGRLYMCTARGTYILDQFLTRRSVLHGGIVAHDTFLLEDEECRFLNPCEVQPCGPGAVCHPHRDGERYNCSCPPGLYGKPPHCSRLIPCSSSPCGPNAICVPMGDTNNCTCLPGFLGSPPACRPECVYNNDCESVLACFGRKCEDPCTTMECGVDASCRVVDHQPRCVCPPRLSGGDPYAHCRTS
ncbi:unnamed protein product [Meganyctiphanes norvegica]|uniref:EGF-like domain-containing protein n=1 Tax=Meganyctiphanes norvegica TaxID=48144 RepID=A0AAV2QBJ2_MEGNR